MVMIKPRMSAFGSPSAIQTPCSAMLKLITVGQVIRGSQVHFLKS